MADKTTYIKIDRNIVEWRWFKDSKVFHVFSWLLIKANIKDHDFMHIRVPRGSLITSYDSIATACGLSVSSVRRVISALETTGEIKREVKNHYQIIEIVNYESYQGGSPGCSVRTGKPQPVEQANGNNQRMIRMNKNDKKKSVKEKVPSPPPLDGGGDVPKVVQMKPIDEGTVEDIPEGYRDICPTYPDYWRLRNR